MSGRVPNFIPDNRQCPACGVWVERRVHKAHIRKEHPAEFERQERYGRELCGEGPDELAIPKPTPDPGELEALRQAYALAKGIERAHIAVRIKAIERRLIGHE